jgi:hypothetical protein
MGGAKSEQYRGAASDNSDPEVKKTIDGVKIITRRTRPVQELRTEPNTCIVNPVGSHQFIENEK